MNFVKAKYLFSFPLSFIILIFGFTFLHAQNIELKKSPAKTYFELHNQLMIVKVDLNEHKNLNFILDTGSNGIIVFENKYFSREQLDSAKEVKIRGMGDQGNLLAYVIKNNDIYLSKKLYGKKLDLIWVKNSNFNLGAKLGVEVHGIIGNDFFRKYVLEINYVKQSLVVRKEKKIPKKYQKKNLLMYRGKPFLKIQNKKGDFLNLLMDTGGVDPIWIYEEFMLKKEPYIEDYLGFGLSGDVTGKRLSMDSIRFNDYLFSKVYVAVPDTIYTNFIHELYPRRNGSLGAGFLNRFNWILDYKNRQYYVKKNANFRKPFNYNSTGIEVDQPLESLKLFIIKNIVPNSQADKIGLKKDDIILSVNTQLAVNLTLEEINGTLWDLNQKNIAISVDRNGYKLNFNLEVKDILQ